MARAQHRRGCKHFAVLNAARSGEVGESSLLRLLRSGRLTPEMGGVGGGGVVEGEGRSRRRAGAGAGGREGGGRGGAEIGAK